MKESVAAALNRLTLERCVPLSAQLELTWRCPLRCRHCYLGPAPKWRELSAAEWRSALRQLKGLGCLFLVLTGGEPLLRKDLPELCRHATKLGFDIRIFTTGLGLSRGLLKELAGCNVSGFELSFYGRPATHDAVTGLPGSAGATLAAARLAKNNGFKVKLKTPLMKPTLGELAFIRKLARREGFGFSLDPVLTRPAGGEQSLRKLRVSGAKLKALLADRDLNPLVKNGLGLSDPASPVCGAGRNTVNISPYGQVRPCLQLNVPLGNLRKKKLRAVWKDSAWLKRWRRVRAADIKDCAGCAAADYCSRCPGVSLLETGKIDRPYPTACLLAKSQARGARGAMI